MIFLERRLLDIHMSLLSIVHRLCCAVRSISGHGEVRDMIGECKQSRGLFVPGSV